MKNVKLKILLVIPSLAKGGAERMVVNIARTLKKNGYLVKIAILRNDIQYPIDDLEVDLIQVKLQLSILKKSIIDVSELQNLIDDFKPDILHSHLFESEIALSQIRLPRNVKRVVHFHDNMPQFKRLSIRTFLSKSTITNFYERHLVLRNLDKNKSKIITISKHSHSFTCANLASNSYPIHLIPNGIDLQEFKPAINSHTKEENTCAMIGSFVEKKGQKLAIETIFELKKRGVYLKLYLIGDGVNRSKLEQLVKGLNLSDLVLFTGNIYNPETFLQKVTFYLHTAIYEALGLVLIEAMACGLPVVCTDGGGNSDLINEGENGFLIVNRDPKLIADKIQFLLENESERTRMGKAAEIFTQEYGMEKYIEQLIDIYSK